MANSLPPAKPSVKSAPLPPAPGRSATSANCIADGLPHQLHTPADPVHLFETVRHSQLSLTQRDQIAMRMDAVLAWKVYLKSVEDSDIMLLTGAGTEEAPP